MSLTPRPSRGLLLIGGATGPQLAARPAGALGMAARPAAGPHAAAVRGAGLAASAALAALRRAAMTGT
ncbi:hypothetical protein OHA72_36605 [Dactylosporangium sp. NBC_01737]|uniref:hypothetical protein n=1 Tax=Dactylosporangium sp. NBC_01737 TaxID=2975959 RepID=UPI002E1268EC|nr:hypothetical protein OHA72_36605 [Dactylosporangium sp. NBC_01737]